MQGEQHVWLDGQGNQSASGMNDAVSAVDQQWLPGPDVHQQATLRPLEKLPDQTTAHMPGTIHHPQMLRTAVHRRRHRDPLPGQLATADLQAMGGRFDHRERIEVADETGDKRVGGLLIDVSWRGQLCDASALHDQDPVPQRHGLALVVRHKHRGNAQAAQQLIQLAAQPFAQLRIQRCQRLIKQQHPRPGANARASATR